MSIEKINLAYGALKNYRGNNGYIIYIKNRVYVYKDTTLNDFQIEFILKNKDFTPKYIGRNVKVAQWWGEKKQKDLKLDFVPKVVEIGYYMGEANDMYVFYARYRKSQERGFLTICRKDAILTDFLSEDYNGLNIDFDKYDEIAASKDSNRKISDVQKEGIKFLLSRKKCILADEMGYGKMEPVDSLIPTPNGFKRMGDIQVGDRVFGSDGTETTVLKTFYHQNKDIYKVTFSDGTSCECGLEHLWAVKYLDVERVMSLKQIIDLRAIDMKLRDIIEIPICQPVQYEEKTTLFDPHLFGEGLGKFLSRVPDEYKLSSIEQRKAFLEGISEGNKEGDKVRITSDSKQYIDDVAEIINSLGLIIDKYEENEQEDTVTIEFSLDSSKEKHRYITDIRWTRQSDAQCLAVDSSDHTYLTSRNYIVTHNTLQLSIAAIEGKFESVLIICPASIKTNWKKELSYYVPEDEITIIDSFLGKKKSELSEFLGHTDEDKKMSREELLEEAKKEGKWQSNHFVIVNYDIIDEFYKVGNRTKTITEEMLNNSPVLKYILGKKSLIIIDEAHKLSNKDSIRYKVIQSLIKRGNPDSVYMATGTPVTNNPLNLFHLLKLINHPITLDYNGYMQRYCGAKKICNPKDKAKRNQISERYIASRNKRNWYDLTSYEKEELQKLIESKCRMITIANDATHLDELKERVSNIYLRRIKGDMENIVNKEVEERFYDLTEAQQKEYNRLWDEYVEAKKEEDPEKELNKDLLEGGIYRKYISNAMVPNTEKIVDKLIKKGEKVVIACCYDEELYLLKDYYGEKAVVYNGKMNLKQKDEAIDQFYNNPEVKVFIANIIAGGVGINLVNACYMVFNNIDYVPGNDRQMEDRIWRITQKRDCHIIYQIFRNTQYEKMWNTVMRKELVINQIIKKESEK